MTDQDHVLKHYGEPYHKGSLPCTGHADAFDWGMSVSKVCGDKVHIEARIEDGVITEIWWEGEGCCFSQAAASMLVKFADGKTVDKMLDFTEPDMFELFRQDIPIARSGCVLVALEALRNLLEDC